VPQHEISLRAYADKNVVIEDADTGAIIGEINRYDAEPIVHPGAIYMQRGDTYRVLELNMDDNIARVRREEVDYYTQPLGGTDIHHIDNQLRERTLGCGKAYWGEVTAYFGNHAFEKISFYTLDAISQHGLELPTLVLETMAFWIVPPESLMLDVRAAGLDAYNGLRGVGYATRMLLPLFITCDTLSFSHTVGSINSPWNAVFIYERYPHGLGFTEKAFDMLDIILPAVLDTITNCPCEQGCPCCVGKPLRRSSTWNVERGEGAIPNKAGAILILEGLLSGSAAGAAGVQPLPVESELDSEVRLERMLRRRLERMREPEVFHPITPLPEVKTEYPEIEKPQEIEKPDVARRSEKRTHFEREMHRRLVKKLGTKINPPVAQRSIRSEGMKTKKGVVRPKDFPGKPNASADRKEVKETGGGEALFAGDRLAAEARRRKKEKGRR
jgi:ATP-dependent helicase YprA (DUF1998 family)